MNNENQTTLSTQGDANEQEDQLGGTTNLSLDQLKKEGGITNLTEDNPDRIADKDDLHEIQAGDDLDEPGAEDYDSETGGEDGEPGNGGNDDDISANDADGNGGYPDQAANPTELNS